MIETITIPMSEYILLTRHVDEVKVLTQKIEDLLQLLKEYTREAT